MTCAHLRMSLAIACSNSVGEFGNEGVIEEQLSRSKIERMKNTFVRRARIFAKKPANAGCSQIFSLRA
jgi:hypothetical protein